MSTVIEEDPQKKEIPYVNKEEKQEEKREETAFDRHIKALGEKYVERCKEMAQLMEFKIEIRTPEGQETTKTFKRKHLTQGQLEILEDFRAEADKLNKEKKGSKEAREANRKWYTQIGKYCLYDEKAQKYLSTEDFDNAVSKDIKPALDGVVLAEMTGVPN